MSKEIERGIDDIADSGLHREVACILWLGFAL